MIYTETLEGKYIDTMSTPELEQLRDSWRRGQVGLYLPSVRDVEGYLESRIAAGRMNVWRISAPLLQLNLWQRRRGGAAWFLFHRTIDRRKGAHR